MDFSNYSSQVTLQHSKNCSITTAIIVYHQYYFWIMKWMVQDVELDQRKSGQKLWKKHYQTQQLNEENAMDLNRWKNYNYSCLKASFPEQAG